MNVMKIEVCKTLDDTKTREAIIKGRFPNVKTAITQEPQDTVQWFAVEDASNPPKFGGLIHRSSKLDVEEAFILMAWRET